MGNECCAKDRGAMDDMNMENKPQRNKLAESTTSSI